MPLGSVYVVFIICSLFKCFLENYPVCQIYRKTMRRGGSTACGNRSNSSSET